MNDLCSRDAKKSFEEWLTAHCAEEEAKDVFKVIVTADAFIAKRKICTRSVFHMIRKNAMSTLYTLKSNREFRKLVPALSLFQRSITFFDEFMSENEAKVTQSLMDTLIRNAPTLDEEEPDMK